MVMALDFGRDFGWLNLDAENRLFLTSHCIKIIVNHEIRIIPSSKPTSTFQTLEFSHLESISFFRFVKFQNSIFHFLHSVVRNYQFCTVRCGSKSTWWLRNNSLLKLKTKNSQFQTKNKIENCANRFFKRIWRLKLFG